MLSACAKHDFDLLGDADVACILGMPFLEICNPQINWKQKTIRIKHKGRLIIIPTVTKKLSEPSQQLPSSP